MPGIVNNGVWYSGVQIPATASATGLVKPDGTTITVSSDGTLSAVTTSIESRLTALEQQMARALIVETNNTLPSANSGEDDSEEE